MEQKELGEKIKKLRKENRDTLKSLAAKIDYDWSNLSKVERGIYGASIELVRKIIDVYDVNPNYFFEGFTQSEGNLIKEDHDDLYELKKKYVFKKGEVEATEEEIIEAIKLLRFLKQKK